jgi:apolipoprotein N-acyltransferase
LVRISSNKFFLTFLAAFLLSIAWQKYCAIFIFLGWVPLLIIEDQLANSNDPRKKLKIFGYSYLVFALWNIGVTWWVQYASFGGALMAFFPNALLMSIAFLLFSNAKARINKKWGMWLIIPFWIAFEYGHSCWDLAWIWLNMGNVFLYTPNWIQWYEITGASGGTAWILAINVLLFYLWKESDAVKNKKAVMRITMVFVIPVLLSYVILFIRKPLSQEKEIAVIVQPNMDPYNVKFEMEYEGQWIKMLDLIRGKVNDSTNYLVLPETFITGIISAGINEDNIEKSDEIQWMKDSLLSKFPNLKIITGACTFTIYANEKEATATARKDISGVYFDCFNTALQIDKNGVQMYHKSKLVPGVERMPFPALFKPLEELAIDMGGTSGSLGTQSVRNNLYDKEKKLGVAPVVCYESVFSDYVSDYIRKGAEYIFILTNDGWWSDSPGHIQHLNYARLRAIETRRQIARSANTGISCVINEFGEILHPTKYWEEAVFSADIYPNRSLTFFSRFGDLFSYFSVIIALFSLLFAFFLRFKK